MKAVCRTAAVLAAVLFLGVCCPDRAAAAPNTRKPDGSNFIVVLDPGHGGSNLGGQIPGLDEKNITLITALAMKEELDNYEGITVYLTRYDDRELSLRQRAEFAAAAGADLFISLHYNKAVPSRLYGAEVWIPSSGENYAYSYACGDLILNELCDHYGLYRRGIKTKRNDSGEDYYGVIKHASELGIPSMIVEHCHLDNEEDVPYFNSLEKLRQLGRLDAVGVAKYFHLKSQALGVDYSDVQETRIAVPAAPVSQDLTPPDTVSIRRLSGENGQSRVEIRAEDPQSPILYYDYSLDGGLTWSALQRWNCAGSVNVAAIPEKGGSLTVRAYNQYDLCTQSNTIE